MLKHINTHGTAHWYRAMFNDTQAPTMPGHFNNSMRSMRQASLPADSVQIGQPDVEAGLNHFRNRIDQAANGFFDLQKPFQNKPYAGQDSPVAFAASMLQAIKAQLSGTTSDSAAMPPQPADTTSVIAASMPVPETTVDETPDTTLPTATPDPLQQAESAVADGYKETLSDLTHMDKTGGLTDAIDQAYEQLTQGLESMKTRQTQSDGLNRRSAALHAYSESRNFQLDIVTRDGDTVTIEINRLAAGAETSFQIDSENRQVNGNRTVTYLNESMALAVSGTLDEDELAAIGELVGSIADLADTFYGQDLQAAIAQAADIGFNDSELLGFALDMGYRTTEINAAVVQSSDNSQGRNQIWKGIRNLMPDDRVARLDRQATRTRTAMNAAALTRLGDPMQLFNDLMEKMQTAIKTTASSAA